MLTVDGHNIDYQEPARGRRCCSCRARPYQSCAAASFAPSASAAIFIHTMLRSAWTRPANVPKPQSTPAETVLYETGESQRH